MREGGEQKAGKRSVHILGISLLLLAVVVLVALSVARHHRQQKELRSRQQGLRAGPRVPVAVAGRGPAERVLTLSGEARPYATVTVFPKVSGYLRRITVDKGDRVRQGQLLAVIESPELDSQYRAAAADAVNKRAFARRAASLIPSNSIARQDADNAEAAARVAEATAASLKTQKGYEIVRAPFAGTVTGRFVDPGTLLQNAANSQTSAQPIVSLSRIDRLRVYLYLDQRNAALVKTGDEALVADAASPREELKARISRISGELDIHTRTMLVELDLDNRKGAILAGGFVRARLKLSLPPSVQVPAEALMVQGEQQSVAVVGSDSRVAFRQVVTGDSDGKMVRLISGVREGERVLLNPGTGIIDGELVQPVPGEANTGGK